MNAAVKLSAAQQKVVQALRSGYSMYVTDKNRLDRVYYLGSRKSFVVNSATLRILFEHEVIEKKYHADGDDGLAEIILTDLGKSMDSHGWCDPIPAHKKMGYEHSRRQERIMQEMADEGFDTTNGMAYLEMRRRMVAEDAANPTPSYRERQAVWLKKQQGPTESPSVVITHYRLPLTQEEHDHLYYLFEHANDPIGQSIFDRLKRNVPKV